ncbi:MAG: glycosyltransferase [Lysobacteraceae bacterium]
MSVRSAPKRRLTVVQILPALQSGGVERSTLEIAAALVAEGHRSVVISAGGRLLDGLLASGSEHLLLDVGAKSLRTLFQIRALRRVLRDLQADIVHVRSRLPAWITRFALRGLNPRPALVSTVHGLNSPGRYSAILTRADRVICVSNTVQNYLRQHYPEVPPERLRVVPRGIDPAAFPRGYRASRDWRLAFLAEHPMLEGGPILTLPGRGTRLKGHAEALHLLAALHQHACPARLLILGVCEPERARYVAELQALALRLGVSHAVVMTPPRHDVGDIYSISHLILQLSSKPEAFGRTVIEALQIGVPVLGFEHGGVGELLRELYPVGCVPLGDRAALLDAALALLEEAPPVAPFAGYRLADMQARTLAIYREVLEP